MAIPNYPALVLKRLTGIHANPVRDWFVLLGLFTLALVGIVMWNVWAFETVANGGSIGAPVMQTPAEGVDQSLLDTVRTVVDDRAAEAAKYESGAYRYTDPSQ